MKTILSATLAVMLALSAMDAGAQDKAADRKIELAIEQQSLADALNEWAKQTGLQLVSSSSEMMNSTVTPSIKGAYTAKDALEELLKGTSLTYEWVSERAVAIREKSPVVPAALQTTGTRELAELPRLQLVGLAAQDQQSEGAEDARERGAGSARREKEEDIEELEEVVVTGTHIRGAQGLPMPVIRVTRSQIDEAGYTRLEDLFRTLPQNLPSLAPTIGEGASSLASDNSDQATGIDLRGLGPQSTLVLLNGQRRAGSVQGRVVDVSAIPLSIIERVEIVTGGRSAIYGSDAVAGVVNLVTRRDFEGAESTVYYGAASPSAERFQFSQIYGQRGDRGGFVAAYDYSDSNALDASEADLVRLPTTSGAAVIPGHHDLLPDTKRHSALLSGNLSVGAAEFYADGLYSTDKNDKESSFSGFGFDFLQQSSAESDQFSVSPGVRVTLSDRLGLDISGVHGNVKNDVSSESTFGSSSVSSEATLSSLSAVLDALVASAANVELRSAIGIEYRWEGVESRSFSLDADRTVGSAFAEALVSMLPMTDGRHRLQVSLAGRYSDYSDFGSSFDPQFGISLNAGAGLTVRGAYSTAFRAPDLYSLNEAFGAAAILIDQNDPQSGGATVPTLIWIGKNAGLKPEEAKTWSVGLDFTPTFAPDTRLSLSYFDIKYDERIDEPAIGSDRFVALANEERYPALINRNPSAEVLNAIVDQAVAQGGFGASTSVPFDPTTQTLLDVFPNLVLFDNRVSNVAVERMRGIDVMLGGSADGAGGEFSFGLNGVYYLDFERKLTTQSPVISALNAPGKLVDLRLRANAGWQNSTFGAFVFVNYVDGYEDTLAVPSREIDSWTTVDATLRLFGSGFSNRGGLDGLTATLGVMNVFDRRPPEFLSHTFGVAYDPANASPLGRFMSLSLVKRW